MSGWCLDSVNSVSIWRFGQCQTTKNIFSGEFFDWVKKAEVSNSNVLSSRANFEKNMALRTALNSKHLSEGRIFPKYDKKTCHFFIFYLFDLRRGRLCDPIYSHWHRIKRPCFLMTRQPQLRHQQRWLSAWRPRATRRSPDPSWRPATRSSAARRNDKLRKSLILDQHPVQLPVQGYSVWQFLILTNPELLRHACQIKITSRATWQVIKAK